MPCRSIPVTIWPMKTSRWLTYSMATWRADWWDLEAVMRQVPEQPITPYRLSILGIGHALLGNRETALGYALDGYERKPLVRLHALALRRSSQ